MKTVCPKGTGVRIPLPAPNKRTTEPKKLGCFLFLWHWYERILTPLCDSTSRRMGFAFERKPSGSLLTSGGAKKSSPEANTPLPSLPYKLEFVLLFSAYNNVCVIGFNYIYNRHCGFFDNQCYIIESIGIHLDFASSHINIFTLVFING